MLNVHAHLSTPFYMYFHLLLDIRTQRGSLNTARSERVDHKVRDVYEDGNFHESLFKAVGNARISEIFCLARGARI